MKINFKQTKSQPEENLHNSADKLELLQDKKKSFWESALELLKFISIAAIIIVPLRIWVAQPFIVHGSSMDPTFSNGDYLIVDEISYKFTEPEKGDVIVFRFPSNPSRFYIKRVIGLPNETLEIEEKTILLKENEYFVLGDNRMHSSDSRIWGPLKKKFIIGRAFIRLFPINKIEISPGDYSE